jgi:hypothetical protein
MKLNQHKPNVQRSDSFEEKNFRIAANAHAFDILSSKLYTDPIAAVIRELSTNAADAHVEAGKKDTSFNVHLPNTMTPYFSIRDFGTGLSEEDVATIYTVYFESTRNNSNEFTGALGLGSKSPLAYTDSFAVTSYYGGYMYQYTVFKGESNEPSIALLNKQASDEPNGIEIRIEVRPEDIDIFAERASEIYEYFEVRPRISGTRIDFQNEESYMEGDDWKLFNDSSKGYYGSSSYEPKIKVVMGNVCYDAEHDSIKHLFGNQGRILINAPIGSCNIAASREELQYDDRTKKYIQNRVNEIQKEIYQRIKSEIKDCKSVLEKLIGLKKYAAIIDYSDDTLNAVQTKLEDVYMMRRLELGYSGNRPTLHIGYDRWNAQLRPNSDSSYVFVECDVEGDIKQKFKSNLRYWLSQRTASHRCQYYLLTIEDRKKTIKILGKPEIKLSEIPDAPRAVSANQGPRTSIKKLTHKSIGSPRENEMWLKETSDDVDNTDAIAVVRKGNKCVWNDREVTPQTVMTYADAFGYKAVYGFPESRFEKMSKEFGLKKLDDVAKTKTRKIINSADKYQYASFHHGNSHYYPSNFLKAVENISDKARDMVAMVQAEDFSWAIRELIREYDITIPVAPDFITEFKTAYPLISSINVTYVNMNDVIEYIKLKENN